MPSSGMPFDFTFGIGDVVSSGINAISQSVTNKKNRQHEIDMANQQRRWALEDWDRETAYNDPSAVMQRNIAAGLNPTTGLSNASASMSAPSTKPTSVTPQKQDAPRVNLQANAIMQRLQKSQVEDIAAGIRVKDAEADKLAAEANEVRTRTPGTSANASIAVRENQFGDETYKQRVALVGLQADQMRQSMEEAAQRIAESKVRISRDEFDRALATRNLDQRDRQLAIDMFNAVTSRDRNEISRVANRISQQNADTQWENTRLSAQRFYAEKPFIGYGNAPWHANPTLNGSAAAESSFLYDTVMSIITSGVANASSKAPVAVPVYR